MAPRAQALGDDSGLTSGRSPVSTSSSLALRRDASSSRRSTSSGSWMWAWWVAKAQYLQKHWHVRESESV